MDTRAADIAGIVASAGTDTQWRGVPGGLPRTFVRCLRDRIQPPELQAKLIENCGATAVIDIDSGHTPALACPAELAQILDGVTGSAARG